MGELHGVPESPFVSSNGQGEAAKHTPGPWGIEAKQARGNWITATTAGYVALACLIEGSESEEDANARLIAAAPVLLAALIAADEALAQVTAFEDDARYIMGNTNFAIVQQRRAVVRAAIALATASPISRATAPAELGNSGTPTNTSTHTGDQPL